MFLRVALQGAHGAIPVCAAEPAFRFGFSIADVIDSIAVQSRQPYAARRRCVTVLPVRQSIAMLAGEGA